AKAKGLDVLSKVALTKAEQLKLATKRSKTQFHSSHVGGSGDGVDAQSKSVKKNLGHFFKMRMMLKRSQKRMMMEEEKEDEEEVSFDQRVSIPPDYEVTDEEENKEGDDKDKEGEQEQDKEYDLYRDVNINLERSDAKMTNAQANQDIKDTHVTLKTVPLVVQHQSSSVSSYLVSKLINPSSDTGIDSILNQNTQSDTLANVPVSVDAVTPSSVTIIHQPPIPTFNLYNKHYIPQQQ
nr:hypothetical protein [Tanacetum cinerariifolium]